MVWERNVDIKPKKKDRQTERQMWLLLSVLMKNIDPGYHTHWNINMVKEKVMRYITESDATVSRTLIA